ncbi:MAG: hypothetical protein FWD61_00615 [Phycisphaerales bacterium]|nr:hypothetical protein [Phycisphaerales bacterium]
MAYVPPADHVAKARGLVAEAKANGGLTPVDLEWFWADQDVAAKDPFAGKGGGQVPLGIFNSDEPVFDELGVTEDFWRLYNDAAWRIGLHKVYNDKAQKIIGKRILSEEMPPPADRQYPPVKMLHDIFEGVNEWHGWSWWLKQVANTEDQLKALLDRVERRLENLRAFMLPEGWEEAKARLLPRGIKPALYRSQRGPCTFACSIFGSENMLLLCMDNPDLAVRFRDLILRAMLERGRILDEEAGYTPQTAPHGFSFFDDNCCLFNIEMYELFGAPILRAIFARWSPNPEDRRFQHSDSAMGHLLPILGSMHLTGANFGPTLTVSDIRKHCPRAVIYGQLAPFTFSRNEEENMVMELLRDFEQAKAQRGLVFATAGSINNGSRLTGMRLLMAAAQRWCRYE